MTTRKVDKKKPAINITVDEELLAQIRQVNEERGGSIAWFVRKAIAEKLQRERASA